MENKKEFASLKPISKEVIANFYAASNELIERVRMCTTETTRLRIASERLNAVAKHIDESRKKTLY